MQASVDRASVSPHWNGGPSTVHVLNRTARIARAAHADGVSDKDPESLSKMKAGDILVSHPTAMREHEISVIPHAPHAMSPRTTRRSATDVQKHTSWASMRG